MSYQYQIPGDVGTITIGPVDTVQILDYVGQAKVVSIIEVHTAITSTHTVMEVQPDCTAWMAWRSKVIIIIKSMLIMYIHG